MNDAMLISTALLQPYSLTITAPDGTPLVVIRRGTPAAEMMTLDQLRAWLDGEGERMLAELKDYFDATVLALGERAAAAADSALH